jgi:hypothetical protein
MQQIQLNIIPFTPVVSKLKFAFFGSKIPNGASIKWDKILDEFPVGREAKHKNYYIDFQKPREGATTREVKFADAINFSLHHFRHLVFNYFKSIQGIVSNASELLIEYKGKLSFTNTKPELLEDDNTIQQLIDHMYQFSRMYWKSISQQNLPVTTLYPEMVARIYPYFDDDNIPEFGKSNLWICKMYIFNLQWHF